MCSPFYERLDSWEEGAGDRFIEEVLVSVKVLETFPLIGAVVNQGRVRRVRMFNRNYVLYYVPESRGVIIHALLDLRQDPGTIAKRLKRI